MEINYSLSNVDQDIIKDTGKVLLVRIQFMLVRKCTKQTLAQVMANLFFISRLCVHELHWDKKAYTVTKTQKPIIVPPYFNQDLYTLVMSQQLAQQTDSGLQIDYKNVFIIDFDKNQLPQDFNESEYLRLTGDISFSHSIPKQVYQFVQVDLIQFIPHILKIAAFDGHFIDNLTLIVETAEYSIELALEKDGKNQFSFVGPLILPNISVFVVYFHTKFKFFYNDKESLRLLLHSFKISLKQILGGQFYSDAISLATPMYDWAEQNNKLETSFLQVFQAVQMFSRCMLIERQQQLDTALDLGFIVNERQFHEVRQRVFDFLEDRGLDGKKQQKALVTAYEYIQWLVRPEIVALLLPQQNTIPFRPTFLTKEVKKVIKEFNSKLQYLNKTFHLPELAGKFGLNLELGNANTVQQQLSPGHFNFLLTVKTFHADQNQFELAKLQFAPLVLFSKPELKNFEDRFANLSKWFKSQFNSKNEKGEQLFRADLEEQMDGFERELSHRQSNFQSRIQNKMKTFPPNIRFNQIIYKYNGAEPLDSIGDPEIQRAFVHYFQLMQLKAEFGLGDEYFLPWRVKANKPKPRAFVTILPIILGQQIGKLKFRATQIFSGVETGNQQENWVQVVDKDVFDLVQMDSAKVEYTRPAGTSADMTKIQGVGQHENVVKRPIGMYFSDLSQISPVILEVKDAYNFQTNMVDLKVLLEVRDETNSIGTVDCNLQIKVVVPDSADHLFISHLDKISSGDLDTDALLNNDDFHIVQKLFYPDGLNQTDVLLVVNTFNVIPSQILSQFVSLYETKICTIKDDFENEIKLIETELQKTTFGVELEQKALPLCQLKQFGHKIASSDLPKVLAQINTDTPRSLQQYLQQFLNQLRSYQKQFEIGRSEEQSVTLLKKFYQKLEISLNQLPFKLVTDLQTIQQLLLFPNQFLQYVHDFCGIQFPERLLRQRLKIAELMTLLCQKYEFQKIMKIVDQQQMKKYLEQQKRMVTIFRQFLKDNLFEIEDETQTADRINAIVKGGAIVRYWREPAV